MQFSDSNNKSLSKSKRHDDGMVYLLENCEKLTNDLKTVMLSTPDNRGNKKKKKIKINYLFFPSRFIINLDQIKVTLK